MFPNSIQVFHILTLLSCYCKCARKISYKNWIHAFSGHCRPLQQLIWNKRSKLCKIWKALENILGYYVGKFFRKYGKSLEKIGKSLGEGPVSASNNRNSSRDIHDFSRMQHPLIWKNIYPWLQQLMNWLFEFIMDQKWIPLFNFW